MQTAGAIRDVVGREGITKLIELADLCRRVKGSGYKWQRGATELLQAGFDPGKQFFTFADFSMLPGGFEAGRMRKAAGRKTGVNQLPEGEIGNVVVGVLIGTGL